MLNMQLYMHNTYLAQFDNKMWKIKRERTCATNLKKNMKKNVFLDATHPRIVK